MKDSAFVPRWCRRSCTRRSSYLYDVTNTSARRTPSTQRSRFRRYYQRSAHAGRRGRGDAGLMLRVFPSAPQLRKEADKEDAIHYLDQVKAESRDSPRSMMSSWRS